MPARESKGESKYSTPENRRHFRWEKVLQEEKAGHTFAFPG